MNLAWQAALSEATPRRSTAGMMTEGQQQERQHHQHHQQQQQRDAPSRSGGMLALLLGRPGGEATAAAAVDDRSDNTYEGDGDGDGDGEREQEVQTVTNANNNANNDWVYPGYDVDFGWRPMPPAPARTSSPPASPRFSSHEASSAVSSFNAYPGGGGVRPVGSTPRHQLRPSPSSPSSSTSTSSQLAPPPSARDEQLLYDGGSSNSSNSGNGGGLRSGRTSIGDEYMQPYGYYLHLPRPSLPSFELLPTPMPIPTISGFMPSSSSSSSSSFPFCPSTTATTATSAAAAAAATGPPSPFEADLYGRMSWPSTPSAMSASSSSLPDIFRPSILFGPSLSSSSTQTYASSWPPPTYGAATGSGLGLTPGSDSASSSSASSSFSCSPPPTMQMLAWQPWQASASPATSPMSSSSSSCSFSSPELSMASTSATTAEPTPTSPTSRSRRKRTRSAGSSESTSSSSKGKKKAGTPSTQSSSAAAAPRKPILRRKMEEEYYHYLKEKLSRMESTRKKRAAALAAGNQESLSSSPESSDLACILSPELGAVSVDDLRREEEQLYMSGTAMECFRYFHEKISSFLVVENVELTNAVWVKSALRSIVCQVTPFALKINAILAFGALIGGQRQWADIFFDKWRRLLTEFFDSSDYEVAEGLTVMSYYLFYLGDIARSRCFGESAAQISVRARPGGGLIFIRAQTITEIISSGASAALCENIAGAGCTSLYLKKPLLTFPATIDEGTRLALSGLLEQLILVSSRIHMWRTCQHIAECRDRGRRARRRRKSSSDTCGGVKKRSQCPNAALSSPLHQLSVLQAVEEKLESLEQRQREAMSHASKKSAGGRKGSVELQSLATGEASEHATFLDDLLAFSRFVLFSVRVDCHREAGMTKNAYTSAEKLLIQLEREADRFMKFVAVLSPLVLSFISPVIELLCGPLQEQFLSAAESVRATTLLLPLGEIFPTLLPVNLTAVAALHAPVSLPVSTSTSSSAS